MLDTPSPGRESGGSFVGRWPTDQCGRCWRTVLPSDSRPRLGNWGEASLFRTGLFEHFDDVLIIPCCHKRSHSLVIYGVNIRSGIQQYPHNSSASGTCSPPQRSLASWVWLIDVRTGLQQQFNHRRMSQAAGDLQRSSTVVSAIRVCASLQQVFDQSRIAAKRRPSQ